MKLETFKFMIDKMQDSLDKKSKVHNLGIDLFDFCHEDEKIIDILIKTYYGFEASEWIDWFIYEKRGDDDVKAYDENDVEICRNSEELWEIVEELRKKETKSEYEMPPNLTKEETMSVIMGFFKDYKC